MFTIDQLPDRTICHDGKTYLFFSGTAYLGMAQNPAMKSLLMEGVSRYGLQFGSSRNGNLQLSVFAEAEARLASWAGAPAALTVSSGMLAGQVVVDWIARLLNPQAIGYQAVGTHPALWHLGLTPQVRVLPPPPDTPAPAYVLTNSIDPIRSETYSFAWLDTLPATTPIYVIVDDSHGLGLLNGGRGIWPELAGRLADKPNCTLLVTASLGKAMGLPGGVIFGEPGTLQTLRKTAFFAGCSPMPPAYAHAFLRAETLYQAAQTQLQRNVALAQELLLPTGLFRQAEGYPVFYTDDDGIAAFLLEKGIFVYSFAYPTAADKANTRVVISAFHQPDDIRQLAGALQQG